MNKDIKKLTEAYKQVNENEDNRLTVNKIISHIQKLNKGDASFAVVDVNGYEYQIRDISFSEDSGKVVLSIDEGHGN